MRCGICHQRTKGGDAFTENCRLFQTVTLSNCFWSSPGIFLSSLALDVIYTGTGRSDKVPMECIACWATRWHKKLHLRSYCAGQLLQHLYNALKKRASYLLCIVSLERFCCPSFYLHVVRCLCRLLWPFLSTLSNQLLFWTDDLQLSSNEVSFRTERLYVNKLNIILVQASGSSLQCVVMCKLLIGRIGIISFFGTERNVLWVCQIFVVKFLLYKDTGNVDWIPFRASFLQEIDIGMNPGALLVHVG